jgi:hypothetical protein
VKKKCCPSMLSTGRRRSAGLGKAMNIRRNHFSGYMLLQVLYVKFVLGSLRSPSYNLRRQINRPNCTISSVLCQIILQLATLALIQFLATNKSTKLYHLKCCMPNFSHNLRLQINQPNCTISSLVCPIFLRLSTLALTVSKFK